MPPESLHCDLKPSNVRVTPDGRVVILDFGLIADWSGNSKPGAARNWVGGTLSYMSPEQAAGEPLTPASDWYSVGVMLHEILTGKLPVAGSSMQMLLDKQCEETQRPSETGGSRATSRNFARGFCDAIPQIDPALPRSWPRSAARRSLTLRRVRWGNPATAHRFSSGADPSWKRFSPPSRGRARAKP